VKPPPPLVPFPVKENENGVWAFAGLEDKMMTAAIGKIQARYFLRVAVTEHDAQRMEIAFTNDMTVPPQEPAVLKIRFPVYID
jgi:hypothetical protein